MDQTQSAARLDQGASVPPNWGTAWELFTCCFRKNNCRSDGASHFPFPEYTWCVMLMKSWWSPEERTSRGQPGSLSSGFLSLSGIAAVSAERVSKNWGTVVAKLPRGRQTPCYSVRGGDVDVQVRVLEVPGPYSGRTLGLQGALPALGPQLDRVAGALRRLLPIWGDRPRKFVAYRVGSCNRWPST